MKKITGLNSSLRLGLEADMVDYKLVLIRRLSVIAIIFIVAFMIMNIAMGYPLLDILINVFGLTLMTSVLIFAAHRKVMVASLMMTIGLILAISAAAIVTYYEWRNNDTENLILAMIVVIVAFFDGWLRRILFFLTFLLLIFLKRYKVEVLELPLDSDLIVEVIIVAVIACGIYFATAFFKHGLEKNLQRVSKLNEEKDELIGVVAHDLKNPLNALNGLLPYLREDLDEKLTEKQRQILETMQASSTSMAAHIDQILQVNKLDTHGINMEIKELDLNPLLQRAVDLHMAGSKEKEIRIDSVISDDKFVALADESCTLRVFENLISNGLKYTPAGKAIRIWMETSFAEIRVFFQDEGPGISAEEQKLLFKRYESLYARPTGKESSTGLGLFTVKKYVIAMGGTIAVTSEEGLGTTFTVGLPRP